MGIETRSQLPVALQLSERVPALRLDHLPPEVLEVARHCLLDWLGCALAGSREPLTEILTAEVAALEGAAEATLIGSGRRCTARTAALVNGAAGHALDFDDTHTLMSGHPSAPVLPAALALAQRLDLPGERLLTAFVAGVEVECRVGALLNPGHYQSGWHATGTMGTFGAAAACSHLLGLDADRWGHALGLAGTQAAGLKASFGTMAKPLHAGKAAADGLLAATLAAAGFTANPAVLEAPQGLAEAAAGGELASSLLAGHEDRFLIRDTLFKYHASCYLTHAAINAALALREQVGPDQVAGVEVTVAPEVLNVCNITRPGTGLEGKFSLRATTAMALLGDDTADPRSYSDARMADADLVSLRDRVHVTAADGRASTRATVAVTAGDGRRFTADEDTGEPARDLDRQRERLTAKFYALAEPVLGPARARALHAAVRRIETVSSVRDLLTLTSL
ncbi:MAG TPA: MmgE/PrpD family protein [Candidatus Dormibacteraeota bacterium]|nr:MmgE/PrpD family protein [Candidatus Dormibacteraeota bacterium]